MFFKACKFFSFVLLTVALASLQAKSMPLKQDSGVVQLLENPINHVFIAASTRPATSLDPIEANTTGNYLIAQLIYAQFVQNIDGHLGSRFLDIDYDFSKKNLTFKVRKNAKYSDGSPITGDDLEFALMRLLNINPDLPVLKDIVGVNAWSRNRSASEKIKGIKSSPDSVSIEFSVHHPKHYLLYRFQLGQLSITPKNCYKNFERICQTLPTSGNFTLKENVGDPGRLVFLNSKDSNYNSFYVLYLQPSELIAYKENLKADIVISTNATDLAESEARAFDKYHQLEAPNENIFFLLINDKFRGFENSRSRLWFADEYRKFHAKLRTGSTKSYFSPITSAYQRDEAISSAVPSFSEIEIQTIIDTLRKSPITLLRDGRTLDLPFVSALEEMLSYHKIPFKPLYQNSGDFFDLWEKGVIAIRPSYNSMRLGDYFGDAKRMLTCNNHAMYRFALCGDQTRELVKKLSLNNMQSHHDINEHLYADAKFSVITHYPFRYYMTKKREKRPCFSDFLPNPDFFYLK